MVKKFRQMASKYKTRNCRRNLSERRQIYRNLRRRTTDGKRKVHLERRTVLRRTILGGQKIWPRENHLAERTSLRRTF